MRSQERRVEPNVVTNDRDTGDEFGQAWPDLIPIGCLIDFCLRYSGKTDNEARKPAVGVNQRTESIDLLITAELDRTDFDDVVRTCVRTCRFEVERYECVFSDPWHLSAFFMIRC